LSKTKGGERRYWVPKTILPSWVIGKEKVKVKPAMVVSKPIPVRKKKLSNLS
jgi:hypothetical protein